MRRCTKCGETKPLSEFHANGPGKWRCSCSDCESVRDKERRAPKPRKAPMSPEEARTKANARRRAARASAALLRPPAQARPARVKLGRLGPVPELLSFKGTAMTRQQWAAYLGLSGHTGICSRM